MKHFRKLNAKGFAYIELVMIVVVIVVIGGIGSYVMLKKSHAATCSNATTCDYQKSWHTIKAVSGTWTIKPTYQVDVKMGGLVLVASEYKICHAGASYSLSKLVAMSTSQSIGSGIGGPDNTHTVYSSSSNTNVCYYFRLGSTKTVYDTFLTNRGTRSVTLTKVSFQRYY